MVCHIQKKTYQRFPEQKLTNKLSKNFYPHSGNMLLSYSFPALLKSYVENIILR